MRCDEDKLMKFNEEWGKIGWGVVFGAMKIEKESRGWDTFRVLALNCIEGCKKWSK